MAFPASPAPAAKKLTLPPSPPDDRRDWRDLARERATLQANTARRIEAAEDAARDLTAAELHECRADAHRVARLSLLIEEKQREEEDERRALTREFAGRAWRDPSARGDPRLAAELAEFSLFRAICAQSPTLRETIDCRKEVELSQELARRSGRSPQGLFVPLSVFRTRAEDHELRVVGTTTPGTGPGGAMIPTDLRMDQFIDRLRAALIVRRLGATVLNGLIGDVDVPGLAKSSTFGWVAENTALTLSDPEYRTVPLKPKHGGVVTEVTRNMLQQVANPDIENVLRRDMAAEIAEGIDRAAISGTGVGAIPRGILNTVGIGDVPVGGPPTWAKTIELVTKVDVADGAGTAFAMNPTVRGLLMTTQKLAATDSAMIMETRDNLAGWPAATSNVVPADTLIFGNWSDVFMGIWSELDVLANFTADSVYLKGNAMIRAMCTIDVALRHAASFAASKDIAAAP